MVSIYVMYLGLRNLNKSIFYHKFSDIFFMYFELSIIVISNINIQISFKKFEDFIRKF